MIGSFEYAPQEVFTKQLEVADIGNTCIRAETAEHTEMYLLTKTTMGKTAILKFGPILPDVREVLLEGFSVTYKKIDYKENNIIKEIRLFLNDAKKNFIDAEETYEEAALREFPDIAEAFNNF